MFSHGYHISDTKQRVSNWRQFTSDVKAAGKEFFSRGEQGAEYKTYGSSTQNISQGLYWSAIFATYCGLDMWNVPWEASAGYQHEEALNFFNRYASHHKASSSPVAFCALRKGLDASDTYAYPVIVYGEANKKNIDRYLKIANAYSKYGAIQGDPPKAIGGGMINRKRQDYNDVDWGIHDSNYQRFLSQIDPEGTSVGWWHRGPERSNYSRFSRSTDVNNGKDSLYFDLDDSFIDGSHPVKVRIVWLDEGKAEWKLQYNSVRKPGKTALTIKNTDSGDWKEKTISLIDLRADNKGKNGSNFQFQCNKKGNLVLHLIEVSKK